MRSPAMPASQAAALLRDERSRTLVTTICVGRTALAIASGRSVVHRSAMNSSPDGRWYVSSSTTQASELGGAERGAHHATVTSSLTAINSHSLAE
jgi:hypothetical protein